MLASVGGRVGFAPAVRLPFAPPLPPHANVYLLRVLAAFLASLSAAFAVTSGARRESEARRRRRYRGRLHA